MTALETSSSPAAAAPKNVVFFPYRTDERWMFDSVSGAERSPRPLGFDAVLDELTAGWSDSAAALLTMSPTPAAVDSAELRLVTSIDVRGWLLYQNEKTRTLCFASPEALSQFSAAPERIYLSVEPL